MYICVCNGIRERDVARALDEGATKVSDVYKHLHHRPVCGKCVPYTVDLVRAHRDTVRQALREAAE